MTNNNKITVFFASDDRYFPYLAVALKSLSDHASDEYIYDVKILSSEFSSENLEVARKMVKPNVHVDFCCIEKLIAPLREALKVRLRDYYSESIYYRIFIPQLFPNLEKAVYLDSDIVLLDDVAKLYNTDLGDNILGVVTDESVICVPVFCDYVKRHIGVKDPAEYFNSGVLVMNLNAFRQAKIRKKFVHLLLKYNFNTVAPDQDYLNFLCRGRLTYLDGGWNKHAIPGREIPLEQVHILHFNMFNKPWHYRGVNHAELFWQTADCTPFAEELHEGLLEYTDEQRMLDSEGAGKLVAAAAEITEREGGFARTMLVEINGELYSIDL
jgi:lipopolysaccharide biosynthesis glycosyltransferase